jgi:hypothetical protein
MNSTPELLEAIRQEREALTEADRIRHILGERADACLCCKPTLFERVVRVFRPAVAC